MKPVEELIRTYIAENILFSTKGFPHSDDTSFLENGIIDSMNVLELVMFIEEKFAVSVSDSEIIPDNFDSVNRLASFIRHKNPSLN